MGKGDASFLCDLTLSFTSPHLTCTYAFIAQSTPTRALRPRPSSQRSRQDEMVKLNEEIEEQTSQAHQRSEELGVLTARKKELEVERENLLERVGWSIGRLGGWEEEEGGVGGVWVGMDGGRGDGDVWGCVGMCAEGIREIIVCGVCVCNKAKHRRIGRAKRYPYDRAHRSHTFNG